MVETFSTDQYWSVVKKIHIVIIGQIFEILAIVQRTVLWWKLDWISGKLMQQSDWTLKILLHPDVTAIFASNWGLDQLWLLFHWTFALIQMVSTGHLSQWANCKDVLFLVIPQCLWSWDLSIFFFNSAFTESPWIRYAEFGVSRILRLEKKIDTQNLHNCDCFKNSTKAKIPHWRVRRLKAA